MAYVNLLSKYYVLLSLLFSFTICHPVFAFLKSPPATLEDISLTEWREIQSQIKKASYNIKSAIEGESTVCAAINQRQGYETNFHKTGIRIRPNPEKGNPEWHFDLDLRGYGYGDAILPIPAPEITYKENRIEYRHGNITEWYVNDANGLEQGFTIETRPEGDTGKQLNIHMRVKSGFTAYVSKDGQTISFKGRHDQTILEYGKLFVTDAIGAKVPANMNVNNGDIVIVVHDHNATYPLIVDPVITYKQRITAPYPDDINKNFGYSTAMDGDFLVIGAPSADESGDTEGAAYVFRRYSPSYPYNTDHWELAKKLIASDAEPNKRFGNSVSISADTIVIGADANDDSGIGAAYIFERNKGGDDSWGFTKKLMAPNGASKGSFGNSVSIHASTVVVGAMKDDDSGSDAGAAYVFDRDRDGTDNWGLANKLTAFDAEPGDRFGCSVSINLHTAVIGAVEDDDGGMNSGSAYVFSRFMDGSDNWGLFQKLSTPDAAPGDRFGCAVSLNGDIAVVGAEKKDGGYSDTGAAYVFKRGQTNIWDLSKIITAFDAAAADGFGSSVCVSGETVAVMANGEDDGGTDSGSVYLFEQHVGGVDNWGLTRKLTASDATQDQPLNAIISLTESTLAIGAPYEDGEGDIKGAAYVYGVNHVPYVISIKRADPNPTKSESVTFAVTFSEQVSGIDLSDFTLETTGLTDGTISWVSSSRAEEVAVTVALTENSGEGTIGLNFVDNDSIIDTDGTSICGEEDCSFIGEEYEFFVDPLSSQVIKTSGFVQSDFNDSVDVFFEFDGDTADIKEIRLNVITPDGMTDGPILLTGGTLDAGVYQYTFSKGIGLYTFYTQTVDKDGNVEPPPENGYDTQVYFSNEFAGYAILAVGGIESDIDSLEDYTYTANTIYNFLIHRGFAAKDDVSDPLDHIKYFNPKPGITEIGEDAYGAGGYLAAFRDSIVDWALARMTEKPGPLYIIVAGHGSISDGIGRFYLNPYDGSYVDAPDFDGWIDQLEAGLASAGVDRSQSPIIILLGTSHSGSFLTTLKKESGEEPWNRIVISSSTADESAYRGQEVDSTHHIHNGDLFLSALFNQLAQVSPSGSKDLKDSFQEAVTVVYELIFYPTGIYQQNPLIDDNGDGIGTTWPDNNWGDDGFKAENIYFGVISITLYPAAEVIDGSYGFIDLWLEDYSTLYAKIAPRLTAGQNLEPTDVTVWAGIKLESPAYDYEITWHQLTNYVGDWQWELPLEQTWHYWPEGSHTIYYYVKTNDNICSPFLTTELFVRRSSPAKIKIEGHVIEIDSKPAKPIAGAIIEIDGNGAYSGTDGAFEILVPDQSIYNVFAKSTGYYDWPGTTAYLYSKRDDEYKIDLTIEMRPIMGNVDSLDGITIADAILSLKILADVSPLPIPPEIAADVNEDSVIGLEEAIFILQKVAAIR